MAESLGELLVRVGADVSGLKSGLRDAVEAIETTGNRAQKVGAAITRAFDGLGVEDSAAKMASAMKKLQGNFTVLENAFINGKLSAADYAKAQEGLRTS